MNDKSTPRANAYKDGYKGYQIIYRNYQGLDSLFGSTSVITPESCIKSVDD